MERYSGGAREADRDTRQDMSEKQKGERVRARESEAVETGGSKRERAYERERESECAQIEGSGGEIGGRGEGEDSAHARARARESESASERLNTQVGMSGRAIGGENGGGMVGGSNGIDATEGVGEEVEVRGSMAFHEQFCGGECMRTFQLLTSQQALRKQVLSAIYILHVCVCICRMDVCVYVQIVCMYAGIYIHVHVCTYST